MPFWLFRLAPLNGLSLGDTGLDSDRLHLTLDDVEQRGPGLLVDDTGVHGPRLAFHQVPEPKTVKNRLHLDLITTEFEVETERLVGLGAQKVRDVEQGEARWTTFRDIEGNEFDLIAG